MWDTPIRWALVATDAQYSTSSDGYTHVLIFCLT